MIDEIVLIGALVGNLTITSYRSTPEQTDSSPFYTSTNEKVHNGGAAISRDLLCGACRRLHKQCAHPEYKSKLHYGQYVIVENMGIYQIFDVMGPTKLNKRTKKRIKIEKALDIWVPSYKEEKKVNVQAHKVYALRAHKWVQIKK